MSTKEKLYIIVPAYNEEENLDLIINQWYPIIEDIGEDSRLVIIDDGSKDHTCLLYTSIGLTCDPQDISEIARCILLLKEDKKLYEKLEENLKLAKKELCWEEEKKILQEALKKLEE